MSNQTDHKICVVCGVDKPLTEYYFRKDRNAHNNRCKRCCIECKNMVRSETHKVCKHCGIEKPFSEFQKAGGGKWLQPYCKPCDSERKKKHHQQNREYIIERCKKYYEANKEVISQKEKEKLAEYRKENPVQPRVFSRMSEEEFKRRKSECDKKYREKNKERVAAKKREYRESGRAREVANEWQKKQMSNLNFRVKKNLRGRIYVALKLGVKSESTMELLGCSLEYFKDYFESLFTEGMSWDRYLKGEIHIDHIIPCKNFDLTKPEEQKKCFHYSNLQPLWEIDNLKKGTRINYKKVA